MVLKCFTGTGFEHPTLKCRLDALVHAATSWPRNNIGGFVVVAVKKKCVDRPLLGFETDRAGGFGNVHFHVAVSIDILFCNFRDGARNVVPG